MVQKVLCIVLVLLWTMPLFMAKHKIKGKYTLTQKINYREEDEIINKPLSCTGLKCNEYQMDKDGAIDLFRSNEILAYNIDDYQRMKSKDSYQNW